MTMMDFSAGAGQSTGGGGVIPNGQLAWAILTVRGVKASKSGGAYIDVELTIDDNQPYARRKIWEMIGDPMNMGNSEAYRQMGMVAISRILEAGRGAGPNNQAAYKLGDYSELSGLRVPIKVKVEKGTGGYDDKNKVAEWLTPNPNSDTGHKDFLLLQSGVHNKAEAAKPAAVQNGFGNAAQPAAQNGGFGSQQGATNTGFGQPAQDAQTAAGQQTNTGFASTQQTGAAPSNGQQSWLQQANQ